MTRHKNDHTHKITQLGNPNDDGHGQCYAPLDHGHVMIELKRHVDPGEDAPRGWVMVDCSSDCHLRR